MTIDAEQRLYIVDGIGQIVRVFDVTGDDPEFLFEFGDYGAGDGEFNYPNDIAVDTTGRLYIADRASNRIQVWAY
jgi:sugar lactone lactonase YvrE